MPKKSNAVSFVGTIKYGLLETVKRQAIQTLFIEVATISVTERRYDTNNHSHVGDFGCDTANRVAMHASRNQDVGFAYYKPMNLSTIGRGPVFHTISSGNGVGAWLKRRSVKHHMHGCHTGRVPVHEEMSWLNAEAERNISIHIGHFRCVPTPNVLVERRSGTKHPNIVVTFSVFQLPMSWLNAEACQKTFHT